VQHSNRRIGVQHSNRRIGVLYRASMHAHPPLFKGVGRTCVPLH
jgi:hypothetical protein